ncbi:MAG: hypothetical protein OXS33_05355 [bacterium]|nr:hypothetical protein [bacterium]MDE0502408.1 hypothetical protein [bacterium]
MEDIEQQARKLHGLLFLEEHVSREDAIAHLQCSEEEFVMALAILKRRIVSREWSLPKPDPTPILERKLSKRARQMIAYG